MRSPQVKLVNIEKRYPHREPIFQNVSLEILSGEFIFLTGVSGAGKSTIFKLIMGLEKPSSGEVFFDEEPIHNISEKKLPGHLRSIGMVFQDFKLLPKKSGWENIHVPLQISGIPPYEAEKKILDVSRRIGIEKLIHQPVESLSGGEQQLIAIARAAVSAPDIILADEPTANLDKNMSVKIFQNLMLLNELGTTVVIATHDIHLIKSQNRKTLLLKKSGLVEVKNQK